MLVVILDAGLGRAAGSGAAGRLDRPTGRLEGGAARLDTARLTATAGLDGMAVTEAGLGGGGDEQEGGEATEQRQYR
jgi:hypothetical protein